MAPVGGRPPQRPGVAEVNKPSFIKIDRVLTPTIIGVHNVDAVWHLARDYRWMRPALLGLQLVRYHAFDDDRRRIEISRDAPNAPTRISGFVQCLRTERDLS